MEKAKIIKCDTSGAPLPQQTYYVQFNPNELTLSHTTGKYQNIANDHNYQNNSNKNQDTNHETLQQRQVDEEVVLTTKLFFNTLDSLYQTTYQDVRELLKPLKEVCNFQISDKAEMKRICFQWGTISIIGILSSYQETYTMFSPDGKPVRAEVSITLEGRDEGYKSVKTKAIMPPIKKSLTPFEQAFEQYKDPGRWKEFATCTMNIREIVSKVWRQF